MKRSSIALTAAAAAVSLFTAPHHAKADAVADYFMGKQIAIQIGFGAGGGYDTTTRIVARHFAKHMPGKPTVVVQNVPGAGSMKVANFVYNVAPKDGTVLGVFSSSVAMQPLFGNRKARFDASKFEWIGSMHSDVQACGVWKGAGQGIKTLPDLIAAKKTIVFGSNSPTSPLSQYPLFLRNALGAKIKVINGYKGTKGVNLAMHRGEVSATCGMFESSVRGAFFDDFKAGDLNLFVQVGAERTVPLFGDATPIFTFIKSDELRRIASIVFGPSALTRPLTAPPGTSKSHVAALRKALLDTMKDPGLIADGKRIKVDFQPMSGDQVAATIARYYETPPALVKKAWYYMTNTK